MAPTKDQIEKAVAALKKLDRGVSDDVNGFINNVGHADGKIGRKEMADISDTAFNGHAWNGEFKQEAAQKRNDLKEAIKLNGTEVTRENVDKVVKASGVNVDVDALFNTLTTGSLPPAPRGPSKTTSHP